MTVLWHGLDADAYVTATPRGPRVIVEAPEGSVALEPPSPGLVVFNWTADEEASLTAAGFNAYYLRDVEPIN